MKKVADILIRKGDKIISVVPNTTVLEALRLMADYNVGSVMVIENDRLLGLMTERDYSRKVILNGKSSTDTLVTEIMTTDLPKVSPSHPIEHCMQLLSARNIRYLPVYNEEKLVGIISSNDIVKETIISQQETISNLQDYLHANS